LHIRQAVIYHLKSGLFDEFFIFISLLLFWSVASWDYAFVMAGYFCWSLCLSEGINSLVVDGNTGQSWDCLEPPLRLFRSFILYPNNLCIYQQEINGV